MRNEEKRPAASQPENQNTEKAGELKPKPGQSFYGFWMSLPEDTSRIG